MTTAYGFDLVPALPEVFLLLAGMALLVVGAMREHDASRIVTPLAALSLLVAALFVIGADKSPLPIFSGHFVFDGFAAFLKVIILLGSAVSIVLAQGYLQDQELDRFEFPLLILFASLGMSMMVSANSFLALYMALELQSLPLYVLAAFNRDQLRSTEAGLKYFVLGALASGMLLYGCSLVYGFTGTLLFPEIGALLVGSELAPSTSASAPWSASSSSLPASPSSSRPCRSTCGRRTSTRAHPRPSPPSSPRHPRSRPSA
jgi:NADH-quinone oxidoreductase subunit N